MNINCSLHTHTTYCDGSNSPREMVESAYRKGCHTYGFSGHTYLALNGRYEDWSMTPEQEEAYRRNVLALREEYRGRMDVLLGIELDTFSKKPDYQYDYTIGSVHFVKKDEEYIPVDLDPDTLVSMIDRLYGGDRMAYTADYYEEVASTVKKTDCDIVGHFDLMLKFNEKVPLFDTADKKYRALAYDALDSLLQENVLLEVNTGGMSRGWRLTPYPEDFIMKRIAEKGGSVIITADAHHADNVLYGYDVALAMLKANGVKNIYTVENGKFVLADI